MTRIKGEDCVRLRLLTSIPHLPEFIFGIVMIVGPLLAAAVIAALLLRRKHKASGVEASSPTARL